MYPTALSKAAVGSRDIMNTRGSVSELPKVQAAVVSSWAPAARSHQSQHSLIR